MKKYLSAALLIFSFSTGYCCETGLSIQFKSNDGSIIKLDDGTIWKVSSLDTIDSGLWMVMDSIAACDDELINTDNGEKVEAQKIG